MYSIKKEITEIIRKYDNEEALLNTQLEEREHKESKLEHIEDDKQVIKITMNDAMKRNRELMKELEIVKARLRSKAIFTPTELQWDEICKKYQETPSLSVKSWRCQLPVFV